MCSLTKDSYVEHEKHFIFLRSNVCHGQCIFANNQQLYISWKLLNMSSGTALRTFVIRFWIYSDPFFLHFNFKHFIFLRSNICHWHCTFEDDQSLHNSWKLWKKSSDIELRIFVMWFRINWNTFGRRVVVKKIIDRRRVVAFECFPGKLLAVSIPETILIREAVFGSRHSKPCDEVSPCDTTIWSSAVVV